MFVRLIWTEPYGFGQTESIVHCKDSSNCLHDDKNKNSSLEKDDIQPTETDQSNERQNEDNLQWANGNRQS